jgi:hypothetical protein
MEFLRELAIGFLDVIRSGGRRDAENFVWIAHLSPLPAAPVTDLEASPSLVAIFLSGPPVLSSQETVRIPAPIASSALRVRPSTAIFN